MMLAIDARSRLIVSKFLDCGFSMNTWREEAPLASTAEAYFCCMVETSEIKSEVA